VQCDACAETALIDQPYCGAHLCGEHFRASVRERARREFHRQLPGFPGGTVAVALSGGKDSAAALFLARAYFGRRPNVRLVAITVDEGIAGYRSTTITAASRLTTQLGVEHLIATAREEIGTTTDESAQRIPGTAPCSFCGVWRRQLLNRSARTLGAEVLVLGFNLDDLAQTVLMNLARGEVDRIGRMAPHRRRQPALVPRVAPLASIPEREVFLFARLEGLPFDHGECPHAGRAGRNVFREVVWRLEEELPGTRHSLMRSRERIAELLELEPPGPELGRCATCGEPASGTRCRSCTYLAKASNLLIPQVG
jgi:uncharacterized protein (TIGR00269 family)